MSDRLFYLILAVVIGSYLYRVNKRRRRVTRAMPPLAEGEQRGPMPGYSRLPGEHIRWSPNTPPPAGLDVTWKPLSMETLHAGRRTRLVLTVELLDEISVPDRFTLLRTLAQRIMSGTSTIVAAVRMLPPGQNEADSVMILARDGRGWTGTGEGATVTARLPDRGDFRMPT